MCLCTEIRQECFEEGEAGVVCITPINSSAEHTTAIISTREGITQSLNVTSAMQENEKI